MKILSAFFLAVLFASTTHIRAISVIPLSVPDQVQDSAAAFRGTVLAVTSFRNPADGMIYTRTSLRVDETFKGTFPATVNVVHRGGAVDDVSEVTDSSPQFRPGEECVIFLSRRSDGTLFALQGSSSAIKLTRVNPTSFGTRDDSLLDELRTLTNGGKTPGADVTDQASTTTTISSSSSTNVQQQSVTSNGLLQDGNGIAARFTAPDRGEPIPYLVDATVLPAGITLSNALNAVSNACAAWSAVSSVKFKFSGTQNFGTASGNISTNDGVFRIQLYDAYNFVPETGVLGKGGRYSTASLLSGAGWGAGGNVAGVEYHRGLCGYVVLQHTNVAMQTLSTLTEVLCHEIGHAIGLAHSSETPNEPNFLLADALMYYSAHADGRGARLGAYDPPVIRQIHPTNNTPPYCYDRVMDVTTSPGTQPVFPGLNQIELRGYDLQSNSLTLAVTNASALGGGTFSLAGNLLTFTPSGYIGAPRIDPGDTSYYEIIYARFSDATSASAYSKTRVISFNPDSVMPSDGIPDDWMTSYFSHTAPQAGDKSSATDDADGDGLNNLQEYIAGMSPTNAASAQRIVTFTTNSFQWQAKAYEVYEIQDSTDLVHWTRFGNPVVPTTSTGTFTNFFNASSPKQFFRVFKVP